MVDLVNCPTKEQTRYKLAWRHLTHNHHTMQDLSHFLTTASSNITLLGVSVEIPPLEEPNALQLFPCLQGYSLRLGRRDLSIVVGMGG